MSDGIHLDNKPSLVALPDVPEPTSHGVIGQYRISSAKIATSILKTLAIKSPADLIDSLKPKREDVPDPTFTGPF